MGSSRWPRSTRTASWTARVEHVVNQDNRLPVHPRRGKVGATQRPRWAEPQVIAVHGHVERSAGNLETLELPDPGGQAASKRHAARRDAEQNHLIATVRPFQDLVGDPGQRAPDLLGIEYRKAITPRDRIAGCAHEWTSFPVSPDGP